MMLGFIAAYVNYRPVAQAGGPYIITPGMGLTLDGSESWDPNESAGDYIASYEWDLNNDGIFDDAGGQTVVLSPEETAGRGWNRIGTSIPISLKVTDSFGLASDYSTVFLEIADVVPPVAAFSITPENPAPDQTVTFDASVSQPGSGGAITTYEWQFHDNTTDTGSVVTHTYSDFGRYPVRLQVTDSDSVTSTLIRYVNIDHGSNAPAAEHGGPYKTALDNSVTLDGSGSTDPDTDWGDYIASYRWYLNEEGVFIDSDEPTATLTPAHFTALGFGVGTHNITLEVTDSQGESDTAVTTLTIFDNLPPVADAGGPYFVDLGGSLTLDAGDSCDPNADNGDSIVSYEWDLDNDGAFDDAEGVTPAVTANTVDALGLGVHSINLRVTDNSGATATAETTLGIYVNELVASFTMSPPEKVSAGQPVSLDAAGSYQTRPDRIIISYEWDFGDGTMGSGSTASHIFPYIGQFTITLTVTDDNVPPKTEQATANIINEPNSGPMADAGGPYVINIGDSLSLDGSGSTDPDIPYGDSIVTYEWDVNGDTLFGDATGPRPTLSWAQLAPLLEHNYIYPADPVTGFPKGLVRLRVRDTTNRTHESLTSLTIYDNNPIASFTVDPEMAVTSQTITFDASGSYHGNPDKRIVSWDWDFGDDSTGEGETVTHAYTLPGDYTVTLTVTDDNASPLTNSQTLVVTISQVNQVPVADAGGPYVTETGGLITLDGSVSYDPDENNDDSIVSYEWDLDNDGSYDINGVKPVISR